MPGGIRLPSEAPAAIEPSTRRSSYFRLRKLGSATVEMVAAVATDEPETAEKIADAAILVCSNPPGSTFSQSARLRYSLSVLPLRTRISPNRM